MLVLQLKCYVDTCVESPRDVNIGSILCELPPNYGKMNQAQQQKVVNELEDKMKREWLKEMRAIELDTSRMKITYHILHVIDWEKTNDVNDNDA